MEIPIDVKLSQDYWYAYNTLPHIFSWLKPPDLLRCSVVCKLWQQIAMDPIFWRSVRLEGCKLDFDKMSEVLNGFGSLHLKLQECIFVLNDSDLFNALNNIPTLRKLELSECSSKLIERLPEANPNLEVIRANIICGLIGLNLNLNFVQKMPNIMELKLYCNRELDNSLNSLQSLRNLQHLYLLGVKNLSFLNLQRCDLGQSTKLKSLGLGDCWNLPKNFGSNFLGTLVSLKKLRLESCRECYIIHILEGLSRLRNLECLELIEINVDMGFEHSLKLCNNIKKLTIVPNPHRFKMAPFNSKIAAGVTTLKHSLKHFTWGFIPRYLEYTYKLTDSKNYVPILPKSSDPLGGDLMPIFVSLSELQDMISSEMIDTIVKVECREYTGSVFFSS